MSPKATFFCVFMVYMVYMFFMVYMVFNVCWCWKMRGNPILAPRRSVWMIKYQHDNVMMVMVLNMIVMIMVMMVMFN